MVNAKKGDHFTEALTKHTVDWINHYRQSKPFMLSLWLYNVHRPADGKPEYYEGGARVPFFVHSPGFTQPETINRCLIQTTDIFPTLVEIAGGQPSNYQNLDGISLVSTIKENKMLTRNEPLFGDRAYQDLYVSVREGNWKMLGYRSGERRLYHLGLDPLEKNNVANQFPHIIETMTTKLITWEKEMGVYQYSGFKK